jgi:hypothetical protein
MKTLFITSLIFYTSFGFSQVSDNLSIAYINLNSDNGEDGVSYKTNTSRVNNRNGGDGYRGENGHNGNQGESFVSNIWKENDSIKMTIVNPISKESKMFAYSILDSLIISICGGNGGNGGNGENGFDGLNGTEKINASGDLITRLPGNGGRGGDGGNGGNGGNGGSISITLNSNVSYLAPKIMIINHGGQGGNGGLSGSGGKAGMPLPQQILKTDAEMGVNGKNGINGLIGEKPVIKIVDF